MLSIENYTHGLTREGAHLLDVRPWHEVEQIVVLTRLELYNRGLPCGPRALRQHLDLYDGLRPLPSERTITRMLSRNGFAWSRTGRYRLDECDHNQAEGIRSGSLLQQTERSQV